ncbi:MAG: cyclic lactone autoinducer peptide [Oscillospiraceae bacterium]|jgi:cyclic lactone autoinducer peptide|nr:cyclic lactone autoinducer peptide [Oscillospiraceae bacterium]
MKKRSRLADISARCIKGVASLGVNTACVSFFYQPKTPANLSKRLKK